MTDAEITRQLAERVMGWKFRLTADEAGYWYDDNASRDYRWIMTVEDWQPLTNIAHAWQVVERMREFGFKCQFHNLHDDGYIVEFFPKDYKTHIIKDKSICRAIALAALAAVEGERCPNC